MEMNTMSETHLRTPQSIFQHMMGQQNTSHEPGSWTQASQLPPQVLPMCMPWSVPNSQQPHLVRFTGENKLRSCNSSIIHEKRKLDVTDISQMPRTKQFISEERMAAHFRDMHISSNYSPTSASSTSQSCDIQSLTCNQVELNINTNSSDLEDGKSMHPRLVISEELKQIQQEPLLPASLLSKLERPSMALVLWEPPSKHLRIFPTRTQVEAQHSQLTVEEENDNNNNNNNNNNNVQIPDLNDAEYDLNSMELDITDH